MSFRESGNDPTGSPDVRNAWSRLARSVRTPRGAFALAVGSLLLIAAGVALDLWMLSLPSHARTPCTQAPDIVTYITAEGTYCEGPNPLIQLWLGLLMAAVGVGLLVVSWRFERRVGWMLHRGTTGLTHASVLAALGLPFVVLSSGSCGPSAEVSGYEVLRGFDFPSIEFLAVSGPVRHFGPSPAIALLIVVALVGLGASGWRDRRSDLLRLGTAASGIAAVFAAFAILPSAVDVGRLTFRLDLAAGPPVIGLALAVSFVVDGQAVLRRRASGQRHRGRGPDP
jgi:hypothetical protein